VQFSRLFGLILLVAVSLTGYGADAEQQNLSGQGSQALAAGDYVGAVTSFSQAIAADKRAVDAYVGIARAYWHQGLAAEGDQAVKKGLRYARRISRVLELHALGIRLGSLLDDPKGIRKARGYYNRGRQVKYSDTHAELHLAMALAWIKAQRLDRAEPLLQKALALDSDWSEDADRAYRRLQMIERASAGSANDVKLAYQASVSRAEITSLLINQIQLAEILERDVGTVSQGETSDQQLTDYHDHPNRDDILTVHRLGLRSLKIRNGRFAPDKPVTRLDLALIIEDILFLKDGISRTQFIGNPSPFSDLKTSNTGFNAVMTAVTRGLIEGRDDGQIQPAAQVSGAETVLVLRRFKKMLK
jgi:tetratricopeptide (TPR) repeat protein|tara:strand:+ start:3603 stop:4679 length:1077 start_codon:yes stop_codon:yes gene_type:complete